jgi:hypothetical protein
MKSQKFLTFPQKVRDNFTWVTSQLHNITSQLQYFFKFLSEEPNFLKIRQITKFDMGFQKKHVSGRSEDLDFFLSASFS